MHTNDNLKAHSTMKKKWPHNPQRNNLSQTIKIKMLCANNSLSFPMCKDFFLLYLLIEATLIKGTFNFLVIKSASDFEKGVDVQSIFLLVQYLYNSDNC